MRQYGIILGVEFGVVAAGAAAIALLQHSESVAPWICLVDAHFFPMAPVLKPAPVRAWRCADRRRGGRCPHLQGRHLALSAVTGAGMALLGYASLSILVGIA
jgi:hypothetical protein